MKTINKMNGVAALVTAALASTGFAPETVWARGHEAGVSSSTAALERRLEQMEAELQALRSELSAARSEAQAEARENAQKIQAQQQKVDEQLTAAEEKEEQKENMIFFRGGYAAMASDNRANQVFSDLYARDNIRAGQPLGPVNSSWDGTYWGAGLDYVISRDLFGLMDGTDFMGEVQFDWKRWDSNTSTYTGSQAVVPTAAAVLGVNPAGRHLKGVTLSQFTLSASPKIKFLKGSAFRPWIIPVGMTFNVISPPSDAGTVLAPGAMFGIGADYNIWQNLYLGLDARYNLVSRDLDGVKADHYQIGGYVGFGF